MVDGHSKKVTASLRARPAQEGFVAVAPIPLGRKKAGILKDESGFNTSMMRLRGRAAKGKRAYGKVPGNRGKNTTLIASITLQGGMGESMSLERGGHTQTQRPSKPTWNTSPWAIPL
jgi:hypothetical protein